MITGSIVLYNTNANDLNKVIKSFDPSFNRKLYLVDNSPAPINNSNFKDLNIEYIFTGNNLGFGKAHNIALKKALKENSTYHIILNPDISFDPKIIDNLKEYADSNPEVVLMMPKVLYPNGKIQRLCKLLPSPSDVFLRRFCPSKKIKEKINKRYELQNFSYNQIINPPSLSGCFMFLKMKTIQQSNIFFDEKYFMYFEDVDLVRRLHNEGLTIYYPKVQIIHGYNKESYRNLKLLLTHVRSALIYFNKYGWFIDKERREFNNKVLKDVKELNNRKL